MVKRDLPHKGVTLTEVVVVLAIAALFVLIGLFSLPRMREGSRSAQCEKNLMSLGLGLNYYAQATGNLPSIWHLDAESEDPTSSAVGAILATLAIDDLRELSASGSPYVAGKTSTPKVKAMAVLICPSDSNAFDGGHPAPLSYRAVTGDSADGTGGPFELGKIVKLEEVENADGLSYTAAFTERLVGTGQSETTGTSNYQVSAGSLLGKETCPEADSDENRRDAGGRWATISWSQSLINHAVKPNEARSCVARNARTGLMSASSGHVGRIASLMLDGSVRQTTPTVAPKLWKSLATINDNPEPK